MCILDVRMNTHLICTCNLALFCNVLLVSEAEYISGKSLPSLAPCDQYQKLIWPTAFLLTHHTEMPGTVMIAIMRNIMGLSGEILFSLGPP